MTCAIELGSNAVLRLVQSWNRLFTPTEATSIVASTIMNSQSNTVLPGYKHGCLDCHSAAAAQTNFYYHQNHSNQPIDFSRQENIIASVRALALQCAHEVIFSSNQTDIYTSYSKPSYLSLYAN